MDYDFHNLEKEKNGDHRTKYLLGGPNLTPLPYISRIIQYKTLRSVFFVIYIIPYYLREVICITRLRKKKKNTICNMCPPGYQP